MKRLSYIVMMLALVGVACSSSESSGPPEISGPDLSVGEVGAIAIDQFYINGGLEDEYGAKGEFSVYLKDTGTGKYIACATQEDGMKGLNNAGIYYSGLSVPLQGVVDVHPESSLNFQVVFVEQDSDGCPKEPSSDDDIAGTSQTFAFDGLFDRQIWAANGKAVVVFRKIVDTPLSVGSMAPATVQGLNIDKLYFNDGSGLGDSLTYYIFAEEVLDGVVVDQCEISKDYMDLIKFGGTTYAALNFPFSCFDATDEAFANKQIRIGVYIQRESGTELVGKTAVKKVRDLIGESVSFTEGAGLVSFGGVVTGLFGASVVRLNDLTNLKITNLTYNVTLSAGATPELQIIDPDAGYLIACAGGPQGLTGVGSPGAYPGLSVPLMAANGQKELFGWDDVEVRLVERTDSGACPDSLTKEPDIIVTNTTISSSSLKSGKVNFEYGAGSVNLGQ